MRFEISPMFIIILTIFIDMIGFGMIIPLLPFYALNFNASSTDLGILIASFSIMQFIFSPILGKTSDKTGRRPILLLSILISCVGFLLFTFASSFLILLLSRIIAGMATETAVAQAYIADITSEKERTKGLGRLSATFGAGVIIGPAIGGFLGVYGFWAPGLAAVFLTLVNFLFVFLFLPEPLTIKDDTESTSSYNKGNFFNKLLNAVTKPLIGPLLIILFIIDLSFSAIPVIVPLLGISFFNFGALEMSYVFIYIGFIGIILQGFLIDRLANRIGEEKMIIYGPILMILGLIVMPIIPYIGFFFLSITFLSLGIGIMRTLIPSLISKRTLLKEQGGILGLAQSVSSMGRVPGPLLGGLIFDFAGLPAPFFVSAIFLMLALGLGCRVFQLCKLGTGTQKMNNVIK